MLNAIRERRERKEREALVKEFTEFVADRFDDTQVLARALERSRAMFDGSVPVAAHLSGLKDRLEIAELDEMLGQNQGELVTLYRTIHEAFERHNLIDIHRLASIPKDVNRINQIESIIDLYNLKLERTQTDEGLSETERKRKLQALEHLMERDISALGEN